MNIEHIDEIYKDSFGLWVSSLFSAISGRNPSISFDEQKEEFFFILRKWLGEGRIRFCTPEDPLNKIWDADADRVIEYLKSHWPTNVHSELDPNLNLYFYEMPAILWADAAGRFHGS